MKRIGIISLVFIGLFLVACGNGDNGYENGINPNAQIAVVTREEGSGTRGAFVELVGLMVDGVDQTSLLADIGQGTSGVLAQVSQNPNAIGYVTIGSIRDDVRPLQLNGIVPTAANVIAGLYEIYRPFYISHLPNEDAIRDYFISFIMSEAGQALVADGYVPGDVNAPEFIRQYLSGSIQVAGSTAVYPIMSVLAEEFSNLTGINVDVLSMGSGAGISQSMEGNVEIGMSSRPLNAGELEVVNAIAIAYDGLAVIVHPNNTLIDNLTVEQVRQIFAGEITHWYQLQ